MNRFRRQDYEALEGWMRFVNSEDESAPRVPMLVTRNPQTRESLRQAAAKVLRAIASRSATSSHRTILLPPRPRSMLHIAGNNLWEVEGEDSLRTLLRALGSKPPKWAPDTERREVRDLSRIRTCREDKCGKLFVAMDSRARYCSPRCAGRGRQRKFYKDNTEVERARKRADYKKTQAKNRERRRAKEKKTFLGGEPIVKIPL